MIPRRVLPTTVAAVLAGALLVAALPAAATAAAKTCTRHKGAIYDEGDNVSDSSFRAWHRRGSLYVCTVEYPLGVNKPRARTRKLGPWTSASRLLTSGFDATWTVRKTVGDTPVDRIWTRDMWTGNTAQSDLPLVPARGVQPAREAQLAGWTAGGSSRAWVTRTGDVVWGADEPSEAPEAHGAVPGPLTPDTRRLLVASYPTANSTEINTLRFSLNLFSVGEGGGDECDYGYEAMLSFVDPLTVTPLGVSWFMNSHNSLC